MKFEDVIKLINKTHKNIAIIQGENFPVVERISTGIYALDDLLDGGFARGRIVEVYAPEAVGKTTLAWQFIRQCQYDRDHKQAFFDFENRCNIDTAKGMGVDVSRISFFRPDASQKVYGESLLDSAMNIALADDCDCVIIDSWDTICTKREMEGEIGDSNIGVGAKMRGQFLRFLSNHLHEKSPTYLIINQLRDNPGAMYGPTEITSGGKSLKYYASIRLNLRKKDKIEDDGEFQAGHNVKIEVVKNSTGNPFRETLVGLHYGHGFSNAEWIEEQGKKLGLMKKKEFQLNDKLIKIDTLHTKPKTCRKIQQLILKMRIGADHQNQTENVDTIPI